MISVVLATFNEEENIKDCLESVKKIADEIIIVDGQSQDRTTQIARNLGAKIYSFPNNPQFHHNKQLAINKASRDWILQLDADERLTPELAQEISSVISIKANKTSNFSAYSLPRSNYFLGKFLTKGGAYPDPVIRLFRKSKARFINQEIIDNGITTANVHAQIKVDGKIGNLKNNLLHYGDTDVYKYFIRFNRYTSLEAENLVKLNKKITLLNYFFYLPTYWFIMRYFRHKAFIDGYQGFLFSLFSSLHYPIIYLKYKEIKNKI